MKHFSMEDWIGKTESCEDFISTSLACRIAMTFGEEPPREGGELPELWHWAFFQSPVEPSKLGEDGHPARGLFLPPADGRNRMWAGGRVSFIKPLLIGRFAKRDSTIKSVKEKQGRSGSLLFVTVEHIYSQDGFDCIREEQDIVYRTPSPPVLSSSLPLPEFDWEEIFSPSEVMLFRYSAVTFNGHRIHYDYPYSTQKEGYPGLVVHGPLIATILLRSCVNRNYSKSPKYFSYRGIRPLIADADFHVGGVMCGDNESHLMAYNEDGPAHKAEIFFEE